MSGAKIVDTAVIETDNSTLPFDSDDMKLEILPPGHDATSNMPIATYGVINGCSKRHTMNVTAGRTTHCKKSPTITERGFLKTSLNVSNLMPNAIPNITNARMIFTISIQPLPRVMVS